MDDTDDTFRHIGVCSRAERKRTQYYLGIVYLSPDAMAEHDALRPRARGQCPKGTRPCPFVGCRHHYAIDTSASGKPRLASGLIVVERNCSLNFVDSHPDGATLEEVGNELLLTRERVRQIEATALNKLAQALDAEGVTDGAERIRRLLGHLKG